MDDFEVQEQVTAQTSQGSEKLAEGPIQEK